MADQDLDQTEEATPHKLEEARKKGSIAKSADLVTAAALLVALLAVYAIAWKSLGALASLLRKILSSGTSELDSADRAAHWLATLLQAGLALLGPLFLMLVIGVVLANLVQAGPLLSFHPLKPDLGKISPANGFKRLMSKRILYEFAKSMAKLIVMGVVLAEAVLAVVPGLLGLGGAAPSSQLHAMVELTGGLLAKLVALVFLFALADAVYARWEFARRMRMSKREIKDEHKNRDGDPRVRGRLKELRKEMLKRSGSLAKVPQADVLITNPTRIAVAISYEHGRSSAPQVIAKGAGELARSMRTLAGRRSVPVVQNKALARALFREVDFDGYVPEKYYPQVARIMVWIYSLRKMQRQPER
jgi:flagellar biosynthetic protein FlhB